MFDTADMQCRSRVHPLPQGAPKVVGGEGGREGGGRERSLIDNQEMMEEGGREERKRASVCARGEREGLYSEQLT